MVPLDIKKVVPGTLIKVMSLKDLWFLVIKVLPPDPGFRKVEHVATWSLDLNESKHGGGRSVVFSKTYEEDSFMILPPEEDI